MFNKRLFTLLLIFVCAASAQLFAQATIVIVNNDADGVGLNDPTPRDPIAGNTGTTLGQQRINVIARAMEIWGSFLDTDVEIRVEVTTETLACDATSAVLASARTIGVFRDFTGGPTR